MAKFNYRFDGEIHHLNVRVGNKVLAHGRCRSRGNVTSLMAHCNGVLRSHRIAERAMQKIRYVNSGKEAQDG